MGDIALDQGGEELNMNTEMFMKWSFLKSVVIIDNH